MTYAEIRQHVLTQLPPDDGPGDIPALLHARGFLAVHGHAIEAATALLSAGTRTCGSAPVSNASWNRVEDV